MTRSCRPETSRWRRRISQATVFNQHILGFLCGKYVQHAKSTHSRGSEQ